MTVNMGSIDRILRLALAGLLVFLALGTNTLGSGLWYWLALGVAAVMVLTSVVRFCPLYTVFGLRTNK